MAKKGMGLPTGRSQATTIHRRGASGATERVIGQAPPGSKGGLGKGFSDGLRLASSWQTEWRGRRKASATLKDDGTGMGNPRGS